MRYPPHTRKEKEVWEVCQQLKTAGQKITYQAVGDKLLQLGYKRGSNSDLYRYITSWRKTKSEEAPSADISYHAQPTPTSSTEQLRDQIWAEANKSIETIKQTAREKLSRAESTINQLQSDNQALQKALQEAKQQMEELQQTQRANWMTDQQSHIEKTLKSTIKEEFHAIAQMRDEELIKLYNHHQTQFDKYLSALDKAKSANALLQKQLKSKKIPLETE